jgi:hypothetical protein
MGFIHAAFTAGGMLIKKRSLRAHSMAATGE